MHCFISGRGTLTGVNMSRADLEGTPYGREIARRLEILIGQSPNIFPAATETPPVSARVRGGAYMAARATCSRKWRTWPNDPEAPFGEMRCC